MVVDQSGSKKWQSSEVRVVGDSDNLHRPEEHSHGPLDLPENCTR